MLELSPRTVVEDDEFMSALDDEQKKEVEGMVNQYESEMVVPRLVSALKDSGVFDGTDPILMFLPSEFASAQCSSLVPSQNTSKLFRDRGFWCSR